MTCITCRLCTMQLPCPAHITAQVYYREAVGAFVVFDLTRAPTYNAAAQWKADLDQKVFLPSGEKIPVILLANKVCMDCTTLPDSSPS